VKNAWFQTQIMRQTQFPVFVVVPDASNFAFKVS